MKWLEICVYTTDAGLDAVTFAFSNAGLDQVSIEESHERAMAFLNERVVFWDYADADKVGVDEPCVKAYVADVPENLPVVEDVKRGIAQLRESDLGYDAGSLSVVINRMDDADWENNWKAYYKPLKIGKRLYVLPCWIEEAAPENRVTLKLDPGVAFGTGEHHTTRMCLELLENGSQAGRRYARSRLRQRHSLGGKRSVGCQARRRGGYRPRGGTCRLRKRRDERRRQRKIRRADRRFALGRELANRIRAGWLRRGRCEHRRGRNHRHRAICQDVLQTGRSVYRLRHHRRARGRGQAGADPRGLHGRDFAQRRGWVAMLLRA
ncbi:MAG: 50S ribosomal protein L11 methyltransferase [Eubacteriales bacterium]